MYVYIYRINSSNCILGPENMGIVYRPHDWFSITIISEVTGYWSHCSGGHIVFTHKQLSAQQERQNGSWFILAENISEYQNQHVTLSVAQCMYLWHDSEHGSSFNKQTLKANMLDFVSKYVYNCTINVRTGFLDTGIMRKGTKTNFLS